MQIFVKVSLIANLCVILLTSARYKLWINLSVLLINFSLIILNIFITFRVKIRVLILGTFGDPKFSGGKVNVNVREKEVPLWICNILLVYSQVRPDGIIEYFYGDQCQCSNASCATYNNLICGGPDRGICDCGTCVCNPRWTGRVCEKECDTSEDNCYDPNDPTQVESV